MLWAIVLAACGSGSADDNPGEQLYQRLCASCHGVELEGGSGPPLGPDSPSAGRSDATLREAITEGMVGMPGFGNSLNDEQVGLLVEFLRARQGT
ncbi:MAG TPA: cytochrome c [Acidimicrobiia bacterium]|nr:cytochrome c [Acidimicrobiia bacterium]